MKKIVISHKTAEMFWLAMKIIVRLSMCIWLMSLILTCMDIINLELVWTFSGIVFCLCVVFDFLYVRKKVVFLLLPEMVEYYSSQRDYWLEVKFKKKITKTEILYDVAYFDDGRQIHTESLSESKFKQKIGENATHYITKMRDTTLILPGDTVINAEKKLMTTPWLSIYEEISISLKDLMYKHMSSSKAVDIIHDEMVLKKTDYEINSQFEDMDEFVEKYFFLDRIASSLSYHLYPSYIFKTDRKVISKVIKEDVNML